MNPATVALRGGAIAAGAALWALHITAASAQTPAPSQSPLPAAPAEKIAPPIPDAGSAPPGPTNDPSAALSRSRGTITPPNVDPGIAAPVPNAAPEPMPVIPPPGSPGGNPTVVPK